MRDPWDIVEDDEKNLRRKMDRRNGRTFKYNDIPEDDDGSSLHLKSNKKNGSHNKKKQEFSLSMMNDPSLLTSGEIPQIFSGAAIDKSVIEQKQKKRDVIKAVISGDLSKISTNDPLPEDRITKIKDLIERSMESKTDSLLQSDNVTADRLNFLKKNTTSIREDIHKKQTSDMIGSYFSGDDTSSYGDSQNFGGLINQEDVSNSDNNNPRNKKIKLSGGFRFIPISKKKQTNNSNTLTNNSEKSTSDANNTEIEEHKAVKAKIPTYSIKTSRVDSKLKSLISSDQETLTSSSSSSSNTHVNSNTDKNLKIGLGGISQKSLGSKLLNLPEYRNFVSAVTFCDCRCDGCETDHIDSNGFLKKNTPCYYKSTNSKIEYCIFDKRWTKIEFDSKTLNDTVLESISVMESSIDSTTISTKKIKLIDGKKTDLQIRKKISLQTTIELIESGQQILPVFFSLFFTNNLGSITLSKKECDNESICWSNILSNLFHNDKEGIKQKFSENDIVKISDNLKKKNSFNRRVCNKTINRLDVEKFDLLISQNEKTFIETGNVRLSSQEEQKIILNNQKTNSIVKIDSKEYKYIKSNLVAVIDSRVTGNEDVVVRSCFVLSSMAKKFSIMDNQKNNIAKKATDDSLNHNESRENDLMDIKNKLLNLVGSFNSGEKISDEKNKTRDKEYISPSTSRDTLTESACFRPVFYKIMNLEDKLNSIEGGIWNDIKNLQIWTYSRSFVLLCPQNEYEDNG